MESVQEQIEYGNVCTPHGNPVGTPSGFDIMCYECEMGLNTWNADPEWILFVGPKGRQARMHSFRFRESEYSAPTWAARLRMVQMRKFLMLFGTEDEALKSFVYQMSRNRDGYWGE
jgi:hypothetical protein